jgi:opacity protein-like surface antigen
MMKHRIAGRSRHLALTFPLLLASMLGSSGSALAQTTAEAADAWQFEVTPYLWATRMKGDVQTTRLPKTEVDMKFSDILENLDFGFMTAFEARKGRWGFLFDGMYMKVSDGASASLPGGALVVDAKARVQQTMLAGAVAYRVMEGHAALDLIGGLRYNKIDVDADIDPSLFGGVGPRVSRSGKKDWVDPYIGLRVIHPLNAKWHAIGYVDVGGFGAGSDTTWQGMAGLSYAYSASTSLNMGYRYMKVDYKDGGFRYDMANDGLYAGVGMRF